MAAWSQVLSLRQRGEPEAYDERILGPGDFVQAVSKLRRSLSVYLYREIGIPPAEIARQVGVDTTGVAMAVKAISKHNRI